MLHIILLILKIIGFLILGILALILLLTAVILLAPFAYRLDFSIDNSLESAKGRIRFHWLMRLISGEVRYEGGSFDWHMRAAWKKFGDETDGADGKDADATEYAAEAAEVKEAFNKKFLTVNRGTSPVPGRLHYPDSTFYGNNTVTANLLPLAFGMIDDDYVRGEVEKNIITNIIETNKGLMPCGIIGGQWLMHGLTDMGRADMAWLLATNKKYPSWGYMTEKGATTIWELWNGDTANPKMNSANHVMQLGDLVSWLYEDVAGISADPNRPGFKHIIMKPDFSVEEMDDIKASYKSIYGGIVSRWHKDGGKLYWHVEIPARFRLIRLHSDAPNTRQGYHHKRVPLQKRLVPRVPFGHD